MTDIEPQTEHVEQELSSSGDGRNGPASPEMLVEGIRIVHARARQWRDRLFSEFALEWLGPRRPGLLEEANRLAAQIGQVGGHRPERRYLLRALPEGLRDIEATVVETGWLPGKSIREWITRFRTPGGVVHHRTVEIRPGPTDEPIRVEERVPGGVFRELWPLTVDRRLRRLQYTIAELDREWRIAAVPDHNLLILTVPLDSPEERLTFPDWLAPWIAREISGLPEFDDEAIARRKPRERI